MWMLQVCAAMMVLCIVCAGLCVGLAIMICHDYLDADDQETPEEAAPPQAEEKELKRRQRELTNFFNYNGDAMPKTEEYEGQDKPETSGLL